MQTRAGFTLLELMVALAMTTLLVSAAFSEMHQQTLSFHRILERTTLSQSARASLDFITDSFRQAGYGFAYDPNLADNGHLLAVASCLDPEANPLGTPRLDNCDAGLPSAELTPPRTRGDLFRVAFMEASTTRLATVIGNAPVSTGPLSILVPTRITESTDPIMLNVGRIAFVSGTCPSDGSPMNRAVLIDDARTQGAPSGYRYQVTLHPTLNGTQRPCGLDIWPIGTSVRIGYGIVRDFSLEFPATDLNGSGSLMLREWRSYAEPVTEILSRQVDDMHISYAMEQEPNAPNGVLDEPVTSLWCNGIVSDLCIQTPWNVPDPWQRAHRVLGVQVMLVMRTRTKIPALEATTLPPETPLTPFNANTRLMGDGYQRYPFSTTIALNNRGLRKL